VDLVDVFDLVVVGAVVFVVVVVGAIFVVAVAVVSALDIELKSPMLLSQSIVLRPSYIS
jgi:hypothetical protein